MAIVIRTLFNNQSWRSPCVAPGKDERCTLCFSDGRVLRGPQREDGVCSGFCWERDLCCRYEWPCIPQGNAFGDRVQTGDPVFLVHRETGGTYTIWGYTHVFSVERQPRTIGDANHIGYAFLKFDDFAPLQPETRPRGLRADELVGAQWGQGCYRYLSIAEAERFEQLLEDRHGIG